MARDAWFVYVARCKDGTLYCGVARDVAERIAKHDAGKGARYTRGRGPLVLHAAIRCSSQGDALRLERAVKRLPRAEKEGLAEARRFRRLRSSALRAVGPPAAGPQRSVGSAQQRKPVE